MLILVSTPALVEVRWITGCQLVLVRGLREDSDGHLCSNLVSTKIYIEHFIELPVLVSERPYSLSHCLTGTMLKTSSSCTPAGTLSPRKGEYIFPTGLKIAFNTCMLHLLLAPPVLVLPDPPASLSLSLPPFDNPPLLNASARTRFYLIF